MGHTVLRTAERIEKPLGPKNSSAVLRTVRREVSAMPGFDAGIADAEIERWVRFYNGIIIQTVGVVLTARGN